MESVSKSLSNDAMASIDQIRRENLAALIQQVGGNKVLADLVGVSESQLSQWAKGALNSATGKPRGMRTETAQRIEQAAHKPSGWMDKAHRFDPVTGLEVDEPLPDILRSVGVMRHSSATSDPALDPATTIKTRDALAHIAALLRQTSGVSSAAARAILREFIEHPSELDDAAQSLAALLSKHRSAA